MALSDDSTTSICIIGPNGTGKSLFAMHLASRYTADCLAWWSRSDKKFFPKVLYVSTDLKDRMAKDMWGRFYLDFPNQRYIPFSSEPQPYGAADARVELKPYRPPGATPTGPSVSDYLTNPLPSIEAAEVGFIDLASFTAGDDWGFLNRVLAMLEPREVCPHHLMVIDAVEGFETLVGERDAFGEVSTRRARVAQIMRIASEKCHIVFIVEEPAAGERVPEEFVSDLVIRLRSNLIRKYARRTVEIEKVRGQSHVRGEHPLVIRKGTGSTTGTDSNWDDPQVQVRFQDPKDKDRDRTQSYIHVFHSLNLLSRQIMEEKAERVPSPPAKFAGFGIRFLDDMLEGSAEDVLPDSDSFGLRCSTVTALIGDPLTQKSQLGMAFLSRAFRLDAIRFKKIVTELLGQNLRKTSLLRQLGVTRPIASGNWRDFVHNTRRALGRINVPYSVKKPDFATIEKDRIAGAIRLAPWLLQYLPCGGVAVLLTTSDVRGENLSQDFECWLQQKGDVEISAVLEKVKNEKKRDLLRETYREQFSEYMRSRIICRRLEIHDQSSAILIHIVHESIRKAQEWIFCNFPVPCGFGSAPRFAQSWPIRLVIDDLRVVREAYPEVREDSLFLPFLLFHLGREGVTSLIIETQPGRPELITVEPHASELRTLVQKALHTWPVPFYGEKRIAITAIPPISQDAPAVIRDLGWAFAKDGVTELPKVDPHFELYSGLEEGRPRPVPLEVRLFAETPGSAKYFDQENAVLRELFTPVEPNGPIIISMPGVGKAGNEGVVPAKPDGQFVMDEAAAAYENLRDFSYTQRDTRLDHTLIFQIDEFWALPHYEPRQLRPEWDYLRTPTVDAAGNRDEVEDPFGLFQPTQSGAAKKRQDRRNQGLDTASGGPSTRLDFFRLCSLAPPDRQPEFIDRVPFTWDFGFLLGRKRPWMNASDEKLTMVASIDGNEKVTVGDVWKNLPEASHESAAPLRPVSWRAFLEACKKVAQLEARTLGSRTVPALFDLSLPSQESFSCLVLEIWASEIYDNNLRFQREYKHKPSERPWTRSPLPGPDSEYPGEGLTLMLTVNSLELFKTWLLLVEVLDPLRLVDPARPFEFKVREADRAAVASRHWYKTACMQSEALAVNEIVVAKRLPGHYSVRGDWFLAVARGSRSGRLADRALDILSSRRANLSRLQLGLGLPTRDLIEETQYQELRTKLVLRDEQGNPVSVTYGHLANIGEVDEMKQGKIEKTRDEFYWLWRSRLGFYVRHARIWQKWLNRVFIEFNNLRSDLKRPWLSQWKDGFELYDHIQRESVGGSYQQSGKVPSDLNEIPVWARFNQMKDFLLAELSQATLLSQALTSESAEALKFRTFH